MQPTKSKCELLLPLSSPPSPPSPLRSAAVSLAVTFVIYSTTATTLQHFIPFTRLPLFILRSPHSSTASRTPRSSPRTMPRTSCSQPPPGSQSSMSGLLNLIQPLHSSATSILQNAVRAVANDKSASPLVRDLSCLERRLVQLADAYEGGDWETRVGEQLVATCGVLQRVDSSTVARPLNELFPEMDALLVSLLPRVSGRCCSLLLSCCSLLARAAGSTGAAAWPRWLLSVPARPSERDGLLSGAVTSILSAADPCHGPLFCSIALLASLCASASHATAVSAYVSHNRLLPALSRLYQRQSALIVQRVRALIDRGQRRLLEAMWTVSDKHAWLLDDTGTELTDRQHLLLLARLQAIIETAIRCGRHAPRQKAACDLCGSPSLFNDLLAAVTSLWDCLLAVCKQSLDSVLSERVRSLSLAALSLMYEATHKSKQLARGGTSEVVGHISVMSQLLDSSSASAAAFYPLLLTVVQQLTLWLPHSPLMCTSVLGSIASAVLEIAMAQRQKSGPQTDTRLTTSTIAEQMTAEQRLDLSPLMRVLLTAAGECVRVVQTGAAPTELLDKVDSCMQATLEAHAYFFRHSSHSNVAVLPDFLLQTCSSLIPLACSILSLTAAATGQPLSAVAVLAVNLERLIEACVLWHLSRQLLACVLQHGLIGWSWRARESLQQLREQCQLHAKDSNTHIKQLETAQRCFDRYVGKLMAAMEWWPQEKGVQPQRSEQWMAALDTLFGGGQGGCLRLIESLHSYPSWRTAANTPSGDQLCQVLKLSVALLLSQPSSKRTAERQSSEQARQEPTPSNQQLAIDSAKLIASVEQLLMNEKQKQPGSATLRSAVFSRPTLLHLCLILLLTERLHTRSASTRAKSALFGFLAALEVAAADTTLSTPVSCCVTDASVGQWLWQQSTANPGAVLLHDQLLTSILCPPTDSRAAASHPPSFSTSKNVDVRGERIHQRLSRAAQWLVDVQAAGPLQALVRRWRFAVQRWQDPQLDPNNEPTAMQPSRSTEVEELLLCTAYMIDRCARKLVTLDLLDPITQLLASSYHHLLLPTTAAMATEPLFLAVDVAAWLVHTLASLLSAKAVPQHIPSPQLERMFETACHLLLVFTTRNVELSAALDCVLVGRSCVQLMNAVLACATTTAHDAPRLLRSFTSDQHSRDALATLISTGFSPAQWTASDDTVSRALRVHLPHASSTGCEEQLQLLRLQLQVECMRLCSTLLLSSTDVVYAMLDWDQCMSVLSHPCDEMKAAAFHYLAACFNCRVLRFQQADGDEQKNEDEEDPSDWRPTEKDMSSAHTLLLAVQACLYPRQRLALSSAALDVLQTMLEASTAAQQRELVDQPWHTFVVQSCLLALAMRPSVHCTPDERDHRVCQLYRYMHLLVSEEASAACGSDRLRQKREAQRHLKDVDGRLLQPLFLFPAIDDQPGSQPPAVVCRTTVHHYLTLLQHLHDWQLIPPMRVRAQLPTHLRLVESIVRTTCTAAVCPAAALVGRTVAEEQLNEMTASSVFTGSTGSGSHSQLPSPSQQSPASLHTTHGTVGETAQDSQLQPSRCAFVMKCVCSSAVDGAEVMVDKCTEAIDKLLDSLQQ